MSKNDGAKQLQAYIDAVRKQGGKLSASIRPANNTKASRRRAADLRAELKKSSS